MNSLNKLFAQLKKEETASIKSIVDIKDLIQKEYNVKYKDCKEIQSLIESLNNTKDFSWGEDGWVESWVRNTFKLEDREIEYFQTYLMDEIGTVYYNKEHDCLIQSQGPSIIVDFKTNEIFDQDSNKTIYELTEETSDQEINDAINEYMNKSGYYPNVFEVLGYNHDNIKLREF